MKILVTNDDGIYAEGLWALVRELKEVGQVVVIAPDREQSGVGTSVTLHRPLRVSGVMPLVEGVETYAVDGTPADCVILGLGSLAKDGIDLIISGVNQGANLGNDVLISGTVGAALQGHFRGIPAIALSVLRLQEPHFDVAARMGALLAQKVAAGILPRNILLNINLPNLPLERIVGIEVTQLALRGYVDLIEEKHDGRGKKYHWIVRGKSEGNAKEGTDIWAIVNGKVSVTPLHNDLTNRPRIRALARLCPSLLEELR